EEHEAIVQRSSLRPMGLALAGDLPADQVGQEVVFEGDEIDAGAVERILRGGSLARHGPAVDVKELPGAVGDLCIAAEVDKLRLPEQRAHPPVPLQKCAQTALAADAGVDDVL